METLETASFARIWGQGAGAPVLSAYLPLEVGQALRQGYEARLMDLLRETEKSLGEAERSAFEVESRRLLSYVQDELHPSGRTLVLFSSAPRDLFEAFSLQIALPGIARFGDSPYIVPLEIAMDDSPPVAVAVADDREARILLAFLGSVEAEASIKDAVPGRQRQGGWSAFKYERDRAHHVHEHLENVASELTKLHKQINFRHLVLGGTLEVTSALTAVLPADLKELLAGNFRAELFASDTELVDKALLLAASAAAAADARLVEEIRDLAYAGGNGSAGWDETMQCLGEGRVQRLAICSSRLGSPEADQALTRAWQTDASVKVVRGEGEAALHAMGDLAALLRY